MSRAFVKEPDGDAVDDDQPDRPQSPHPNYVTPGGLRSLEEGLAQAREEQRRLAGDADDLANKLPLARIARDIRYLEGRLERAIVVDPLQQAADEVCFGATVTVEDEDGAMRTFAIVGEDEADAAAGKVSWVSPLAQALLGSAVGDALTWERPAGDVEVEIVSIRYRTPPGPR